MRRTIGFLLATAFSAAAAAQPAPDPLEACYQKPDGAARLACFDQEMQRRHATGAPQKAPANTAAPAARAPDAPLAARPSVQKETAGPGTATSHVDDNVGLEGAQLRKKLREQGISDERPKPQPIVAQVAQAKWRADHRYTFLLDNGQIWEQVEDQPGLFVDAHESVTISPGVLGSFFLKTSKDRYVRVRRLQ